MRRPWALPLVPLWWAGNAVKDALHRMHRLPVRQLAWPVLSVGSLSAGGAGKTPVVRMLAGLLAREGFTVDVLSRGYGRGSGVVEAVDPNGSAQRFGDEPLELAQAEITVFVGADRHAAGRLAEQASESGVHLLDDGFQHRQLARALDIVLLTREDIHDWLLPAGNLRESVRALRRAHVVILREEEAAALLPVVQTHTQADIWPVRRQLVLPPDAPQRPIIFSGIARPEGFLHMMAAAGVNPAGTHTFPDHHAYTDEDFKRLAAAAEHAGADGYLTTAKDAVKITPTGRKAMEELGPIAVAPLRVSLVDEETALQTLRATLAPRMRK